MVPNENWRRMTKEVADLWLDAEEAILELISLFEENKDDYGAQQLRQALDCLRRARDSEGGHDPFDHQITDKENRTQAQGEADEVLFEQGRCDSKRGWVDDFGVILHAIGPEKYW